MTDKATLAERVARVNTEGVNLTAWELGFMETITDQFERLHGYLSEWQQAKLEQIYAERTP